jgi:hypothetical protein
LTTSYNCDKSGIFANLNGTVNVTWDSYSKLDTTISFLNNQATGSPYNCTYYGEQQQFAWKQGDWRVASCDCQSSCCYQIGSSFNVKALYDIQNKPQANFTGQLTGDFCNNTMATVDTCYLDSTQSASTTNYTTFSLNCTTLGCKTGQDSVKFTIATNETTSGYLQWNGCTAKLVLRGSSADKSTSFGGRLGAVLVMFLVVALMQLLN